MLVFRGSPESSRKSIRYIDELRNSNEELFNRNNSPSQQRKFPKGREENPAECEVELTTTPSIDDGTHWGQQVFLLHPPVRVNQGDEVLVNFSMSRSEEKHRLIKVDLGYKLRLSSVKMSPSVINNFLISAAYESSTASFMGTLSGGLDSILDLFSLRSLMATKENPGDRILSAAEQNLKHC
ncbi:hypothetical protein L6452_01123 [Arctium lappa]|uniref:Uncharacterized protein n=1 Tax=Arctium lappa TaxID=4217 RepID=A0ACB9FGN1_ARCLA|nr:hypothetical protein L6452_01123 [Arctium lappa]